MYIDSIGRPCTKILYIYKSFGKTKLIAKKNEIDCKKNEFDCKNNESDCKKNEFDCKNNELDRKILFTGILKI